MEKLIQKLIEEKFLIETLTDFNYKVEEIKPSFQNLLKFIPNEDSAIEIFMEIYRVAWGQGWC